MLIQNHIFAIRGEQVMIDRDLAALYGVETKRLNEAVKRNLERFPAEFRFQLTKEEIAEYESLRSQIVTLNGDDENLMSQIATSSGDCEILRSQIATLRFDGKCMENGENDEKLLNIENKEILRSQIATLKNGWGTHTKYATYAFTEQGVAMLSTVLKSATAVQMSIKIMNAFVKMRRFLQSNAAVFTEISSIKKHLLESDLHQKESDKKIEELFTLMDKYHIDETQGVFFEGQIFDAYAKFESFLRQAKKEIVLIDNYVDLSVLERLSKKKKSVNVKIWTNKKTSLTQQDVEKFNSQYPTLALNFTTSVHDRFLIIDGKILYHFGASLKDLGKKCFAFEILDSSFIPTILERL